jgi:hypothetical protein
VWRKKKTDTERQTYRQMHTKTRAREFRSRETDGHSRLIYSGEKKKNWNREEEINAHAGHYKRRHEKRAASVFLVEQGGAMRSRLGDMRETRRASSPKRSKRKQQHQQQQQETEGRETRQGETSGRVRGEWRHACSVALDKVGAD